MKYTVVGGNGFIGREICFKLNSMGHKVFIPKKNDPALFKDDLGIVIYSAGFGDCGSNPFKVINSNISSLCEIVDKSTFKRLVYISSSRLYLRNYSSNETDDLKILFNDDRRLFNLTKLVSEELCLLSKKDIIIVRPSNVYGMALNSNLYLPSIIRNAILNKHVDMYVSKNYAKDYVSVHDVAEAIYSLTLVKNLNDKVFNLASGVNTSSSEIANMLKKYTDCKVIWHTTKNEDDVFPVTKIDLINQYIDFSPKNVLEDLPKMISQYKEAIEI